MNVRGWSLCLTWRPSHGIKTLSVTLETVDAKANTRNTAPKTSPTSAIAELLCMLTRAPPNDPDQAGQANDVQLSTEM